MPAAKLTGPIRSVDMTRRMEAVRDAVLRGFAIDVDDGTAPDAMPFRNP